MAGRGKGGESFCAAADGIICDMPIRYADYASILAEQAASKVDPLAMGDGVDFLHGEGQRGEGGPGRLSLGFGRVASIGGFARFTGRCGGHRARAKASAGQDQHTSAGVQAG